LYTTVIFARTASIFLGGLAILAASNVSQSPCFAQVGLEERFFLQANAKQID
jgi:hypothetical protein